MGDLRGAHEEVKLAEEQVLMACMEDLLYKTYSLKPNQFYHTRFILQLSYQPFRSSFTDHFEAEQNARYISILIVVIERCNTVHLCFIYMAKRIMMQQVIESMNVQFLSQQLSSLRRYACEVLNGCGQYGG